MSNRIKSAHVAPVPVYNQTLAEIAWAEFIELDARANECRRLAKEAHDRFMAVFMAPTE